MEGYAKISSRISNHPELGIYRRFAALNAQNILYLQAEIHELEADLHRYAQEDTDAPKPSIRTQFSRNWQKLARATDGTDPQSDERDRRQWNTFLTLRAKLKEYNEVLVQQAVINQSYRPPRVHDLDVLRTCLNSAQLPDFLLGFDSTIWDDPKLENDLITFNAGDENTDDPFTLWFASHIVEPFHNHIGRHLPSLTFATKQSTNNGTLGSSGSTNPSLEPDADFVTAGIVSYSDRVISRFASLLVTVISSVFPIVGVIILYFVKDTLNRLGIIAALTALFSLSLALMTNARKSEIWGATAAFSAVLVVFLGTGS